ncbi:MAG: aryl-sulfate sulfotransferase [Planctomycetota bacterium]
MHRAVLSAAFAVLAATSALAQPGSGVAHGFRLYGPFGNRDTYLVDPNGAIVHTWTGSYVPGNGIYLEADGTLLRAGNVIIGGPPLGGRGGSAQRIAFDGTILWDYRYATATHWAHHDIEPMPNGNVLFIAWDWMTAADAIAAGRDPALIAGANWLPDHIVEVRQTGPTTGDIVWEWHLMDHVIQDVDPTKANYGVVGDHPELVDINFPPVLVFDGDWNHANAVSYDPVRDLIVFNSRNQGEFYVLDHSTTTAEAAAHTGGTHGKGGDILYRWGNPAAYRAGTAADQKLFGHHGAMIIPQGIPGASNVLVFNNKAGTPIGRNYSSVLELELPPTFNLAPGEAFGPTDPIWDYTAAMPGTFYSSGMSNAERLPNGNTLICSGRQRGWMFEVNPAKQIVWEYFNTIPSPTALVFQVSYVDRSLWADVAAANASTPVAQGFDLVAGTPHAGSAYVLLGSASGTTPVLPLGGGATLPLRWDAYTAFTLTNAGGPALPEFVGVLDAQGRATANLRLPPLPGLEGITFHHAFAVVDSVSLAVTSTSNPVPLTLQ